MKKSRGKDVSAIDDFKKEVELNIAALGADKSLSEKTLQWMIDGACHRYVYNFSCLGRPIIQFPQDMVAIQELVWKIKPDLIIETGIAHGGSLVLSASMLALLDMEEAIQSGGMLDPLRSRRKVLGIDIDIRDHNRAAIEAHPMCSRIQMIEGSSIAPEVIEKVREVAVGYERVMVILDSNHTHEHVLAELKAYAPLVSIGSYCVVFDTLVEDMPASMFSDRPWAPGNSPKTAVWEYLESDPSFEVDRVIQDKLLITVAPDGYLKKIG